MDATPPQRDVTGLLLAWRDGDASAFDALVPLVYAELHRMARRQFRGERAGHTLQPTALVHEVFLRLIDTSRVAWQDRSHFLAMAARLMRRVLVDAARRRRVSRRSGGVRQTVIDLDRIAARDDAPDLVRLDDALEALAGEDPRKARVVELRYFGGLSVEETAAALAVSTDTVGRDWRLAKAWLRRELHGEADARD